MSKKKPKQQQQQQQKLRVFSLSFFFLVNLHHALFGQTWEGGREDEHGTQVRAEPFKTLTSLVI